SSVWRHRVRRTRARRLRAHRGSGSPRRRLPSAGLAAGWRDNKEARRANDLPAAAFRVPALLFGGVFARLLQDALGNSVRCEVVDGDLLEDVAEVGTHRLPHLEQRSRCTRVVQLLEADVTDVRERALE